MLAHRWEIEEIYWVDFRYLTYALSRIIYYCDRYAPHFYPLRKHVGRVLRSVWPGSNWSANDFPPPGG